MDATARTIQWADNMTIIIGLVISFWFVYFASRAFRDGDTQMVEVAIIGLVADIVLMVLMKR